jgi:signal transduction histidine kinase
MSGPRPFLPKGRAERVISVARVTLAACSLLAISLDPSEPTQYADVIRALTIGYTAWAVILLLVSRSAVLPQRWPLSTHALDLAAASLFINFSAGTDSPFFLYLIFALMSAALRWEAAGVLWTGVTVLVIFYGTFVAQFVRHSPVELNALVIRTAYLAVLAVMLSYLSQYGAHVRQITQKLRSWQPAVGHELADVIGEAVRYGADVVSAPRAVIVWEDPEELDLRMTWWAHDELSLRREDPAAFEPLVADPFRHTDFLCRDASTPHSAVMFTSPTGLQTASGPAIHREFVDRFGIRTLLGVRCGPGRLFIIDKPQPTADDLWLAQTVAHQVASSLDQVSIRQRLEEASVLEARARVARDLHDGLLQTLAAIMLRLQAIGRAVDEAARQRIESLQAVIGDEARRLRVFIQDLTASTAGAVTDPAMLSAQLELLAHQIERDWGLRVELKPGDLSGVPPALERDIYFVVREALINAARHADASIARATMALDGRRLDITVTDDGRGFPFEGRYDGAELAAMNLAPKMLYERVASLRGRLLVESGANGSRVDIEVPVTDSSPP